MIKTTYRIEHRQDGSFAVEVVRFGALPQTAAGFPTEAAVQGWIEQDKRIWETTDPYHTPASRRWNGR